MKVYSEKIEKYINLISKELKSDYNVSKRSIALFLLQDDQEMKKLVSDEEKNNYKKIITVLQDISEKSDEDISYLISKERQDLSNDIVLKSVRIKESKTSRTYEVINSLVINPLTGVPILILVLYFVFYKFVGGFGAGTLVDFIEGELFDEYLIPKTKFFFEAIIPWSIFRELFTGEYGIFTLGIKYAIAIIMPVVGSFFLLFSLIEDSGYLPRISFLLDRVFKKIGLNGRAIIPLTLGLGCGTMATTVTRTLESKRERIIATLLLALAIPCSAQLGVIVGILSYNIYAMTIWVLFISAVFFMVGSITEKILPGKKTAFYMEMPPLRLPNMRNVFKKTYTRLYWYFREIIPIFIYISIIMWFLDITNMFDYIIKIFEPAILLLDLPSKASEILLIGFFRRDYGAAGLMDMFNSGILSIKQLLIICVVLTLYVPCVAQFSVMIKERGLKVATYIGIFVFAFALLSGYILNKILNITGFDFGM